MGKRRDARLAAAMGVALEKAGRSFVAQPGTTSTQGTDLAPRTGYMPDLAQALARQTSTFGAEFGPNFPLIPDPINQLGPNGRPDPRKWDLDIAWNLQITRRLATWGVLKAAAEQCDVVARMITIRAAEVAKMDKSWIVSDEAVAFIRDRDNVGTAEASSIAREENKELIASLNDFWENPYPQSDRGWREWITEAIWQIVVYDGLAIHPQMNLGRDVIGLNIIDAATIKCYLNNYGDIPRPPDPAFGQILKGFPRGEFLSSNDKDARGFVDGQFGTTMRDQLSYFVMNRRTWTPYGFSPVEQAIPLINLYLEYQKMMIFEFTHGTQSDVYMKTTGQEIDLKSITNWERIYNDYVEGQTATRKKTRLLPDGFDPIFPPKMDEKFKPDYIESILKRMAGIFGVSSQQVGVIPHAGMGGGKGAQEGDQDNAETVSSKPMMNFIEEFVNNLSRRYLGANKNVTFILTDDKGGKDDVSIAQAAQINTSSGVMVLNEQRRELGLDDYDFDGADEPFIVAGNTVVYLRGEFANQMNPPAPIIGDPNVLNQQTDPGGGDTGQGSQKGSQGQKPQEGGQPPAGAKGQAPPPGLKAEMADFAKFVARQNRLGTWRNFDFTTVSSEVAEAINEDGYFIAKGARPMPERPTEHFLTKAGLAPRPKDLLKRKSEDLPSYKHLQRIAKDHAGFIRSAIVAGVTGISAAIERSLAKGKVDIEGIAFDHTQSAQMLANLYRSAGNLGAKTAADSLGLDVTATKSTAELLEQAGITLKGIDDTALTRISNAIGDGITAGSSSRDIGTAVNAIIDDPLRSDVIATTEANRAFNAEFIGQIQAAGQSQYDWITDGDPCPECEEMEGPQDLDVLPPPLHPNCECVAGALDPSSGDENP